MGDKCMDFSRCDFPSLGVNAGHYTAYAKNPKTLEWFYYNDETYTHRTPGENDFRNTYILFYQLQGERGRSFF